jgi:hypothetical protein
MGMRIRNQAAPIKLTGGMPIKVRIFGQQSSDQASGKLVAISTIW